MSKVDIKFTGHWRDQEAGKDYAPGDTMRAEPELASALVSGGVAAYATKSDADKADAPEGAPTAAKPIR